MYFFVKNNQDVFRTNLNTNVNFEASTCCEFKAPHPLVPVMARSLESQGDDPTVTCEAGDDCSSSESTITRAPRLFPKDDIGAMTGLSNSWSNGFRFAGKIGLIGSE